MTLLPHRKNDATEEAVHPAKATPARPCEFGVKVSIVITNTLCPGGQFVLHAKALSDNRYDGHTLREGIGDTRALAARSNAAMLIRACGHDTDNPRRIFISGQKRGVSASSTRAASPIHHRARDRPLKAEGHLGRRCAILSPSDISLHPRVAEGLLGLFLNAIARLFLIRSAMPSSKLENVPARCFVGLRVR